jgi:2-(1,2-epoxy-1,2-dihydrophenyl)acetyl-CoA isomerase
MASTVLLEREDGVARITLNRPAAGNALDADTAGAFCAAVDETAGDPAVRAVLLTGAGPSFCVGGDIAAFRTVLADLPRFIERMLPALHRALHRLATLPVPVISAVNGPLGGGGIGLALSADLVLAAESAKLRGGYTAIGLSPDLGSSFFLARRAGAAQAKEILFLNRPLSARECLAAGIFDAVHPDDRLAAEARDTAARLAAGAAGALARVKQLVDADAGRALEGHLARELAGIVAASGTADAREGITAFMEKRAPRFGR